MPQPMGKFEPHLLLAEDSGIGGKLSVRLWIDEMGTVEHVSLLETDLPESFTDTAISAFNRMRFSAGEIEGRAVKVWADIVVEYAALNKRANATEADVAKDECTVFPCSSAKAFSTQ